MMMRYSFGDEKRATRIEAAVDQALDSGIRTADIFEKGSRLVSTKEMGDAISDRVKG